MRRAATYHLHVPTLMKSGSLKLMEPSGLLQGLLHFFLFFYITFIRTHAHTHARAHAHTHTHTHMQTFAVHRITDSAAIILGVCVCMYVCMYVHVTCMFNYLSYEFIQTSVTHAEHHNKNLWTTHLYVFTNRPYAVPFRVSELQTAD